MTEREPHKIIRPPGISISDVNIIMFAATADTGRPVIERKAHRDFLQSQQDKGVPMRTIPSRYHDSREGTLTNVSALEAMTKGGARQKLLDSLSWIHDRVYYGEPPARMTDREMLELANIGEALPSYLILRAENPIDRQALPEEAGNIWKVSSGLRLLATTRILAGQASAIDTPGEIYTAANGWDLLNDKEDPDFSCAGPPELISKATDAMIFGRGGNPRNSILDTLIPEDELGDFFGYSSILASYRIATNRFRNGTISLAEMTRASAGMQNEINELLGRDPSTVPPPDESDVAQLYKEGFVSPPGSIVRNASRETRGEKVLAPGERVETLVFKPGKKSRSERRNISEHGSSQDQTVVRAEPPVGQHRTIGDEENTPRRPRPFNPNIFKSK